MGVAKAIKVARVARAVLVFFFFFFFYSHLTPHSPTGMAGGPIRTPTRGANYIHTQKNL